MEAGIVLWLAVWLVLWAVPAAIANVPMARRRRRTVWGWGVAAIPFGWLSSLVLQRLGPQGASPLPSEAAERGAERGADRVVERVAAPEAPAWVAVRSWAGSGSGRTDVFPIASQRWRVRWKTTGPKAILGGMMQALLYREDGTPVVNSFLANTTQAAQGTADLDEGPGCFCLIINSVGFDWEVSVEEQR